MTKPDTDVERLQVARKLMDEFAARTGLTGTVGNPGRRYLWTDAYAVQAFFALAHACAAPEYHTLALRLVETVHETLGRFRPDDMRQGWISGLSEGEGKQHLTAGGLRIGKDLPERGPGEPLDEQLEWERDGQYFHYLTRWIQVVLQAERETGDHQYAVWAHELLLAGGKFMDMRGGRFRMYWKMSTDLSRPLVSSMGEHDPLDGLTCAVSVRHAVPERAGELDVMVRTLSQYCRGYDWSTMDALGIGGLLLSTARVANLALAGADLPEALRPAKLLADSLNSLSIYAQTHTSDLPADHRLAFRECGLSLGLRVVTGLQRKATFGLNLDAVAAFLILADQIEEFWMEGENQQAETWTDHEDINAVTLAASLVAADYPGAY